LERSWENISQPRRSIRYLELEIAAVSHMRP
jgi:hypothetical protein